MANRIQPFSLSLNWGNDTIKLLNIVAQYVNNDASDSDVSLLELATSAEGITGTDTSRAMTPATTKAAIEGATHTITAVQTFTAAPVVSLSSGSTCLTLQTDDAGATGTTLTGFHNSASPAANDIIFRFLGNGRNSTPATVNYGQFRIIIDDATAGSEDAHWEFTVQSAGAGVVSLSAGPGVLIGSGTIPAFGNLNVDGVILKDNTQVVSGRKTGWTMPTGTASRATFDTATVTTAQLAQRVFALMQDLGQSAGGHGLTDA